VAPCHAASTSHPLTCGARRRTRTSLFAFVAQSPHPEVRAQHMERGSPLVFQRPDNTWRPWLESNQQPSVLETEAAPPPHGPTDSRPTTHLRCKQSALRSCSSRLELARAAERPRDSVVGWRGLKPKAGIYLRLMKSQPSPAYLWQPDVFRPTPLMGRSHINVAAGMVTCLMAIISEARPAEC
jgi:hypothetical protein